jgi:SAM-dependent methyltransferase
MPHIPDFADPRYLDEVGWFLWHEKYARDDFGGSYQDERLTYSRSFMDEVLELCGQDHQWLAPKTVLTIGCGCTGDLAAWPAAVKIAADPLLYAYQKLGMLVDDLPNTSRTLHLSVGIEELPLLDECVDLVVCRNALDHMPDPRLGLQQVWRMLRHDGAFFVSVDIGGVPTPDEPTVFSIDTLAALFREQFEFTTFTHDNPPHSQGRTCSVRLVARKKSQATPPLDKARILQAYEARVEQLEREVNGRGR